MPSGVPGISDFSIMPGEMNLREDDYDRNMLRAVPLFLLSRRCGVGGEAIQEGLGHDAALG